jgi:carboxypeptidase C (cathepsin A)
MPSSSYTGYIDIEARHLFFYFFESRSNPDKDDVILWTNGGQWFLKDGCSLEIKSLFGCKPFSRNDLIMCNLFSGPGCSSSLGLFMELGTYLVSSFHGYEYLIISSRRPLQDQ